MPFGRNQLFQRDGDAAARRHRCVFRDQTGLHLGAVVLRPGRRGDQQRQKEKEMFHACPIAVSRAIRQLRQMVT
jgi:hypothetical protein